MAGKWKSRLTASQITVIVLASSKEACMCNGIRILLSIMALALGNAASWFVFYVAGTVLFTVEAGLSAALGLAIGFVMAHSVWIGTK